MRKSSVVVGHGKDEVVAAFESDKRIHFVEQTEQLGTGHAARMAEPLLKKTHGDVFILAGDVPLVGNDVLTTLHRVHMDDHASASMATAVLEDPTGYGRIMRDPAGEFVEIVEQVDCTPQQREIKEVFPSYYCVKVDDLLYALANIKNENKKGEYYLTDIYEVLRAAKKKIVAVQAATYEDVLAPNTRQQLAEADMVMQDRIQRNLRDSGVTHRQRHEHLHRRRRHHRARYGDSALHLHRPRHAHRRRMRHRPLRRRPAAKASSPRVRPSPETSAERTAILTQSEETETMAQTDADKLKVFTGRANPAARAEHLRVSANSAGPRAAPSCFPTAS